MPWLWRFVIILARKIWNINMQDTISFETLAMILLETSDDIDNSNIPLRDKLVANHVIQSITVKIGKSFGLKPEEFMSYDKTE
jgi:hypothetical protein